MTLAGNLHRSNPARLTWFSLTFMDAGGQNQQQLGWKEEYEGAGGVLGGTTTFFAIRGRYIRVTLAHLLARRHLFFLSLFFFYTTFKFIIVARVTAYAQLGESSTNSQTFKEKSNRVKTIREGHRSISQFIRLIVQCFYSIFIYI